MRCCHECGEEKPLTDFATAGVVKGVKYYRYKCIPCYAQFKYIRKRENRAKLVELRKTLECKACGNNDHRVLEFHHRDPSQKERAVTEMMHSSWKRIMEEVAKCDVLCANCHRILHYEEREAKKSGD